jgi:hypothetical protein
MRQAWRLLRVFHEPPAGPSTTRHATGSGGADRRPVEWAITRLAVGGDWTGTLQQAIFQAIISNVPWLRRIRFSLSSATHSFHLTLESGQVRLAYRVQLGYLG